jgi:uncharacterized membrane protein
LGFELPVNLVMLPGLAALFYYLGILLENSERNWSIGIRTPWTLSNDIVWKKTNVLGGKLFKFSVLIVLLGLFSSDARFPLLMVYIIGVALFLIIYSYIVFKKTS